MRKNVQHPGILFEKTVVFSAQYKYNPVSYTHLDVYKRQHYATAAVLMLRYYGVPARYVEGYYLRPEEANAAAPGEELVLDETHAHAWAEYYLDGIRCV